MRWLALVLTMLTGCVAPACAHMAYQENAARVADRVLDSTVLIKTPGGHGSGFAVTPTTIITARHVVDHPNHMVVTTRDDQVCEVEDLVISIEHDLAALRISNCDIKPLELRSAPMQEGEEVHVAGNPGQLHWSITEGHVMDTDEGHLVIDAVGLPGMSGGPVVDKHGHVVGVAVLIRAALSPMPGRMAWGGWTKAEPASTVKQFVFP